MRLYFLRLAEMDEPHERPLAEEPPAKAPRPDAPAPPADAPDGPKEECLICGEELPVSQLCGDVEGSAGPLAPGCKHLYCASCVRALPASARKCGLCNVPMIDAIVHTCRRCAWVLMVEAGGAGSMRFASLTGSFDLSRTKEILEVGFAPLIHPECLASALKALPCYVPPTPCKPEIAEALGYGAAWNPLFEGQTNPVTDMFICTSLSLLRANRTFGAVVAGPWEGSDLYYYGIQYIRRKPGEPDTVHGLLNCDRLAGICEPMSLVPPPRLLVATEEAIHRLFPDVK